MKMKNLHTPGIDSKMNYPGTHFQTGLIEKTSEISGRRLSPGRLTEETATLDRKVTALPNGAVEGAMSIAFVV